MTDTNSPARGAAPMTGSSSDETAFVPWYEMPHGIEREIAKYDQCEEPGDCDHDHDNAIEYFREQELDELRAELAVATARAEQAEARLAELGEPTIEHGIRWPNGIEEEWCGFSRAAIREAASAGRGQCVERTAYRGPWQPPAEQQRQGSEEGTT